MNDSGKAVGPSRQTKLLFTVLAILALPVAVSAISLNADGRLDQAKAVASYEISFSPSKNKSCLPNGGYGPLNAYTNAGSALLFTCDNFAPSSDVTKWGACPANGYFRNDDPIHGITKIEITLYEGCFTVYVGTGVNQYNAETYMVDSDMISTWQESFTGTHPSFFKILGTTSFNSITSIKVTYTCGV